MSNEATAGSAAAQAHPAKKTKAERAAEALARLKPWKPGQSGNPRGGAVLKCRIYEQFRSFMSSPSDFSDMGETNRLMLWKATLQSAIMGEAKSQEVLIHHDLGNEESKLAVAEHFRSIARDQFDILVKMLGDRLKTMSVDEMSELLAKCDRNPRRFIEAAQAELAELDGRAGAIEVQVAELSPPEPAASGDPEPAGQAESPDPETARPVDEDGDE